MTSSPGVAVVVSHVVPVLGMEQCVLRLTEALGDRVDLVCIGEDPTLLAERGMSAEILGGPLRGIRRLRSLARLYRWIRRDRHDVVLVAGAWAALPLLAMLPRGRRVIVWEHSLSAEKTGSSRSLALLALAARLLYRRAHRIVCVSDDLGRQLVSRVPGSDPVIIPNYLGEAPSRSATVARPLFPPGVRRLLTVGSLTTTKNQVLALAALLESDPNCVLVLAGDGPQRPQLEAFAEASGLKERVLFLGHVADLAPWYRWCEAVVQPARGETFGLAMFEAAAHHRAVVSLDYGLARDVVGSAVPGALAAAATPTAFAGAIRTVLASPPGPADFENADRDRSLTYSPDVITGRWLDVLGLAVPASGATR